MVEITEQYKIGVRRFGLINWTGAWTLYKKEVLRFLIVWIQTIFSPLISSLLFLLVLSLIGNMKWLIFIPSLILIFLSFENIINDGLRPTFNFLGDLTYGMYLWHLPVEIFIMITLLKIDYSMSIFLNPLFLIFHVLIVIIISIVGYLYYEKKIT